MSLVAITYVYFLIFAQFAFLKRLDKLGIAATHLQAVMAAMAAGGILASLLAPRLKLLSSPDLRLRAGLVGCGAAALFAYLPLNAAGAAAVSSLIGLALGLLTVTLVTHLKHWTGERNPLLAVGIGTGLGYFVCNLPFFFSAPVHVQALSASALCAAAIAISLFPSSLQTGPGQWNSQLEVPFFQALVGFTALVWLDSAAFFTIQNTPALKAGTWEGTFHLWTNAALHFVGALASVALLRRKGLSAVLVAAFVALGTACLLLLDPERAFAASFFYPIGVSLYSVALVAYPSMLAHAASTAERGRMAGWLYAVAGWVGSAMGIGMAQHLGHVPPLFVAAAGLVILLPQASAVLRRRIREVFITAIVLLVAIFFDRFAERVNGMPQLTQVERGRQVYISEGCIHCHSQFVRQNSSDVLMWGPASSVTEVRSENPPLIGNRRQGPDLAEVGSRRSPLWLKAHFYNPAQVSGASIMPSYGFLFRDQRGDDLVTYLESLGGSDAELHIAKESAWQLSTAAFSQADAAEGEKLYERDCATCHSADGATRRTWQKSFKRLPPDLVHGPFRSISTLDNSQGQLDRLAQIVKFGIPGTDMPGHEYLPDHDVASLSLWISERIAQMNSEPTAAISNWRK